MKATLILPPRLINPKRNGVAILVCDRALSVTLTCERINCRDMNGFWQWPGGAIEPGESAVSAAHRELLEETGMYHGMKGQMIPLCMGIGWTPDNNEYVTQFFIAFQDHLLGFPHDVEADKHGPWQTLSHDELRKRPLISLMPLVLDELQRYKETH